MAGEIDSLADEVAIRERRVAVLRERLLDLRGTLAERRTALEHARALTAVKPRFRLDECFLLGMLLGPAVTLLVIALIMRLS